MIAPECRFVSGKRPVPRFVFFPLEKRGHRIGIQGLVICQMDPVKKRKKLNALPKRGRTEIGRTAKLLKRQRSELPYPECRTVLC